MPCCYNQYSNVLTGDIKAGAAQAMLRATGMSKAKQNFAQIGIGAAWFEGNPCNMHLRRLGDITSANLPDGLLSRQFHTIGVSDGITMGTSGMNYSLPSRDIIADSVEAMIMAHHYDGAILLPGCDKNMPGMLMGALRYDRPTMVVYGGTIKPGTCESVPEPLDVVSAFQAYGMRLNGSLSETQWQDIIDHAIPGAGACGGMYTANSMAVILEILGITPLNSSSHPADSVEKVEECSRAGALLKHAIELGIKPSTLVTRRSLMNCIRMSMVMGSSTNVVLHLLAIANEAGIPLTYEDFIQCATDTPVLADVKPSGRYLMNDIHEKIHGTSAIMKYLIDVGILDGDTPTMEGISMHDRLKKRGVKSISLMQQDVIRMIDNPMKADGHIKILKGSLAPNGAVSKISGKEGTHFQGPAKVFENEEDMILALSNNEILSGMVVVVRNCGPVGGPGMPEMLRPTSALVGAGLKDTVAMITDGRFSGGSHGFIVGHVEPEAVSGGPIGKIQDGDIITIDTLKGTLDVDVAMEELMARPSTKQPLTRHVGYLNKYRVLVGSASGGASTTKTI